MSAILNKITNDLSIRTGAVVKYEISPQGVYHNEEGFAIFCDGLQTRLFFTFDAIRFMTLEDEEELKEIVDLAYQYLIEDGFLNKEN